MDHMNQTNETDNSNLIISWLKKVSPQARCVFLGALFFGLFAHGMGLFNKFSHHDDVAILFDQGSTVSSGRWMLQVLAWLETKIYGTPNTSLPLYNGLISLVFIGLVGCLLVRLLKIKSRVYCTLLGCILVAFPVITSLFAYMFTSHPYMLGLLMMTVSACLICGKTPWWSKLIAIFVGGAGVGVYQAYLPFFVTIILLFHIMNLAENKEPASTSIKKAFLHLLCILGVMLIYVAGNQFFLNKYQVELSAYQGIADMGKMTFQSLMLRLVRTYREFFIPTRQVFGDMYPGTLYYLHILMLASIFLLALRLIVFTGKKDKVKALLLTLLFALFPLGSNLIYIMVEDEVHSLMVYGQVMQVLLFIWLFDRLDFSSWKLSQVTSIGAALLLSVTAIMYARYDNQCYLKDALHQQEAISYYTTLITRIKSQPGYQPEMRVIFANAVDPEDDTVYNIDELDFIRITPYWHNSMEYLHCPTRNEFIRVWCGADFLWGWDPDLEASPEVQAMPSYPADGSIQIINDSVVIKF